MTYLISKKIGFSQWLLWYWDLNPVLYLLFLVFFGLIGTRFWFEGETINVWDPANSIYFWPPTRQIGLKCWSCIIFQLLRNFWKDGRKECSFPHHIPCSKQTKIWGGGGMFWTFTFEDIWIIYLHKPASNSDTDFPLRYNKLFLQDTFLLFIFSILEMPNKYNIQYRWWMVSYFSPTL